MSKPCFICHAPSEVNEDGLFFDAESVFDRWSYANRIICNWRSRFDGVRVRLKWAALDETEDGAHATCVLEWAIREEGFAERYPAFNAGVLQ